MDHHDTGSNAHLGELPRETEGLPEARSAELVELADGDEFELEIMPVKKRIGDATVRMLAYNGSIPGPTLKLRQGSTVTVHVRRVRSKVESDPTEPVRLVTVWGIGYRWEPAS